MDNNPYSIYTPDPPLESYMVPPGYNYNPNQAYYSAVNQQQFYRQPNITTYQPVYNNPYIPPNMYYQQQRQPWQLIQPQQSQGPINPFIQNNSYNYYNNGYYYNQPIPSSYIEPGFNPSGVNEMYSPDMRRRLDELDSKYQKLNTEKAIERRNQYSNYGYNYYGMMNQNYIDPVLHSQYNKEKAEIEAEAKDALMDFHMRLSRAVHTYLGDIDMNNQENIEKMKQVYSNKVIPINQEDYQMYQFQRSLERGRDITEEAKASAIAADRKVSEYFHNIVNPNADLDEFLDTGGMILWQASVDEMNKKGATLNERYSYNKLQQELQRNLEIRDGEYPSSRDLDPCAPFAALARSGLLDPTPGIDFDINSGTISLNRDEWAANKARIEKNREQMNYEQERRAFIESVYNPIPV